MSFDWTKYLLAESIYNERQTLEIDEEAICRCAISRAYYAAYCYARNIALDYMSYELPQNREGRISVHDHLINFFKNQMALPGPGAKLGRLREWRTSCDYEDIIPKKHGNMRLLPTGAFDYARAIIDDLTNRYINPGV
jgi:hypothetical protein